MPEICFHQGSTVWGQGLEPGQRNCFLDAKVPTWPVWSCHAPDLTQFRSPELTFHGHLLLTAATRSGKSEAPRGPPVSPYLQWEELQFRITTGPGGRAVVVRGRQGEGGTLGKAPCPVPKEEHSQPHTPRGSAFPPQSVFPHQEMEKDLLSAQSPAC